VQAEEVALQLPLLARACSNPRARAQLVGWQELRAAARRRVQEIQQAENQRA